MRPPNDESQFRVEQAHDIFQDLVTYLIKTGHHCDDPQARLMFETATDVVEGLTEVFGAYEVPHETTT